jgi:hypothetical protein
LEIEAKVCYLNFVESSYQWCCSSVTALWVSYALMVESWLLIWWEVLRALLYWPSWLAVYVCRTFPTWPGDQSSSVHPVPWDTSRFFSRFWGFHSFMNIPTEQALWKHQTIHCRIRPLDHLLRAWQNLCAIVLDPHSCYIIWILNNC